MPTRENLYATATDETVATALRTMAVSFEDGMQVISPSEQSADLLSEAASRLRAPER